MKDKDRCMRILNEAKRGLVPFRSMYPWSSLRKRSTSNRSPEKLRGLAPNNLELPPAPPPLAPAPPPPAPAPPPAPPPPLGLPPPPPLGLPLPLGVGGRPLPVVATVDGAWVWVLDITDRGVTVCCGDGAGVPVFKDVGMFACQMRNSIICGSSVVEGELSFGEDGGVSFGEGRGSSG